MKKHLIEKWDGHYIDEILLMKTRIALVFAFPFCIVADFVNELCGDASDLTQQLKIEWMKSKEN